jgi:hypothetical protein
MHGKSGDMGEEVVVMISYVLSHSCGSTEQNQEMLCLGQLVLAKIQNRTGIHYTAVQNIYLDDENMVSNFS